MNRLEFAIYGASGYGREVFCYLKEINNSKGINWNFLGFFDDGIPSDSNYLKYGNIIGGIDQLNSWQTPIHVIIAIANPLIRERVFLKINNEYVIYPNLINSDLRIYDNDNCHLGVGNIIFSKCSFSVDTEIGDFNIFNGSISVGHDSKIGNFNTFMPGSKVSGLINIGNGNQFGMNSTIIQGIKVGNNNVVAPNTFLSKSISDDSTYFSGNLKKL